MQVDNIKDALKIFNKIEDKRDEIRAVYEKQDSKLRAARDEVEAFLLAEMRNLGLKSFELPGEGVAAIKEKRRFGCADWAIFWDWIIQRKTPEMLQKRLLDSAVQKYVDDNGELPPGINSEARLTISVTKRG